ncbi:hypothetical protein [Aequorivita sinensis]|nr:hypothetical protein [Aequorivita sinensis]
MCEERDAIAHQRGIGGAAGFGGSLTLLDINGGLGNSKAKIGKSW